MLLYAEVLSIEKPEHEHREAWSIEMQASLSWSPEQCFIETMLGPIHLAPAHKPSCQCLPLCLGRAQSYQWFVWANPANPASPHGHFVSLGSAPLIQSCRRKKPLVLSTFLFCTISPHTNPMGGSGEENLAVQLPPPSFSFPKISRSLIQLEMMWTEQVVIQGGILDCAGYPMPSCRDQLCVMSNQDLTERIFPATSLHS